MRILTLQTAGCDFYAEALELPPRAVFVHGLGGDAQTWDSLWGAMGPTLSALRYDLRGFGRSMARQSVPYDHADDLLELLDAFGIEACELVGVSMGGSIALSFTLDHPERVHSLTLLSPGIVGWEWSDAWRERWERIVTLARSGAIEEAKRRWWEHPLFATTRMSAAGPVLLEAITRYSGAQWIDDAHVSKLPDIERLHTLTTPTLLLTGERDLDDFRLIAEIIAGSSPAVRRIDMPALGHLLHLEDPRACARHIHAFWSGLDRPRASPMR